MIEFSSFLFPWNAIFSIFSRSALFASIAMFALLWKAQGILAARDVHSTAYTFWGGLLITGIFSIVAVFFLQVFANHIFVEIFVEKSPMSILKELKGAIRCRWTWATLAVMFVVGGGYAFSDVEAPLLAHIASCTAGIGVLEEAAKSAAALMVFALFYRSKGGQPSLIPFVIAGLAFGAGEAIHYFAAYNLSGSSFIIYIGRAWWCVPLHAAWAIIAGERIMRSFNGIPSFDSFAGSDYWPALRCLLPSIVLHGVYNAFCLHGIPLSWLVGIGSIIWGGRILAKSKNLFAEHVLPTSTSS